MSHLRWNPLQGTYIMVAANRQNRPHLPKDYCPFCPGSGKVPDNFDIYIYPNDFPALSAHPQPVGNGDALYKMEEAYGHCEVILYSPDHYKGLSQLSQAHITQLVKTWANRYSFYSRDEKVQYIFPFENRGEEVGVTMPHPHGQLYAYPFIPQKVEIELANCQAYYQANQQSMLEAILARELADAERVVYENQHFAVVIPWFTDYPYGAYILPKQLTDDNTLQAMSEAAHSSLADALRKTAGAFDALFDKPFPYMMCLYQAPVNTTDFPGAKKWYPFHIKFYTPLRSADKIKWMASSETGAGAAANTLLVEDTAQTLREALAQYLKTNG